MVECKSHANETECVASLVDCCVRLRREFGYSRTDARSVVLNNVRAIACSTLMILNLLEQWSIGGNPQSREQIARLLGLKDFTTCSVQRHGNRLHKTSKLSLVLLAQFQIESCLKNLARDIQLPEAKKNFYVLAKALLDRLKLSGDFDMFYTPARIRNSLHGPQGIHDSQGHKDPPILTISGMKYEFRHGEKVGCAYVEHIMHLRHRSMSSGVFSARGRYSKDPVYEQCIGDSSGKNGEETT